jgi:hypothetical protein
LKVTPLSFLLNFGERVLKGRSNGQTAYVNGENKGGSGNEFGAVGTERFSQAD